MAGDRRGGRGRGGAACSSAGAGGPGRAGCRRSLRFPARRCSAGGLRFAPARTPRQPLASAPGGTWSTYAPAATWAASTGPRRSDDAHPALVRVAQAPQRRVGDGWGCRDRVHAEGRAGTDPGRRVARGHDAAPWRDRIRKDDPAGVVGARRDQARNGRHLHRSQGRRLRARGAPRGSGPRRPAVSLLGPAGQDDLQPLRAWVGHRDRGQAARGGGVHRAALPAARAAVHRPRNPGAAVGRSSGQPRDGRRAHEQWTARIPDAEDELRPMHARCLPTSRH